MCDAPRTARELHADILWALECMADNEVWDFARHNKRAINSLKAPRDQGGHGRPDLYESIRQRLSDKKPGDQNEP